MLRLPEFNHIRAKSIEEAAALLADLGPEALAVAGATDLYPINLFDMQQKYADVVATDEVMSYLEAGVPLREETPHRIGA